MRTITPPLLLLLTFGCGQAGSADASPKSRANERGAIERHLRDTRRHAPPAQLPSARREPAADPASAIGETAAPEMSEAARAQQISATHVHEHGRVDEPVSHDGAQPATVEHPAVEHPTREHPTLALTEEPPPLQVTLARVVVASSITDREPDGLSPFTHDVQRLYVFIEARNAGAPTTLEVRWIAPDGTAGRPIELALPTARRWRTWATTRRVRGQPGTWTAVVRDARGEERGRSTFVISAAPAAA